MRPVLWGIIIFVLGIAGWVVSIVFNVLTLGRFRALSNFIFVVAFAAIPVAILLELIRWFIKRKK